jgi:hypothetical protein
MTLTLSIVFFNSFSALVHVLPFYFVISQSLLDTLVSNFNVQCQLPLLNVAHRLEARLCRVIMKGNAQIFSLVQLLIVFPLSICSMRFLVIFLSTDSSTKEKGISRCS